MFISNSRPGQPPVATYKKRVVNRCGATALAIGDVVAFDHKATQTETRALAGVGGVLLSSLRDAMWSNIIEVGAAPANAIVAVVTSLLSGAGADNTEVEVAYSGHVQAKIGGTDWSVAYSSSGVALMADTTGANRRLILATDNPNTGKVALIEANVATDLSAANALTNVVIFGFGSSVGPVGDA